jgi:hypothetical protein
MFLSAIAHSPIARQLLKVTRPSFYHYYHQRCISIPPLTPHTQALADQLLPKSTSSSGTNGNANGDCDDDQRELQRRFALARAITLLESTNPKHADDSEGLLAHLLHSRANNSPNKRTLRIGIAGPPGAGK